MGVVEVLCSVGDDVVDVEGCWVGDDAGVLVVEVSFGGVDEVAGVGELAAAGELVSPAVAMIPWRGTRMFIGWTSTGIFGRSEKMFIEGKDEPSSRLRGDASKKIRAKEEASRMPTMRVVREGVRMLREGDRRKR